MDNSGLESEMLASIMVAIKNLGGVALRNAKYICYKTIEGDGERVEVYFFQSSKATFTKSNLRFPWKLAFDLKGEFDKSRSFQFNIEKYVEVLNTAFSFMNLSNKPDDQSKVVRRFLFARLNHIVRRCGGFYIDAHGMPEGDSFQHLVRTLSVLVYGKPLSDPRIESHTKTTAERPIVKTFMNTGIERDKIGNGYNWLKFGNTLSVVNRYSIGLSGQLLLTDGCFTLADFLDPSEGITPNGKLVIALSRDVIRDDAAVTGFACSALMTTRQAALSDIMLNLHVGFTNVADLKRFLSDLLPFFSDRADTTRQHKISAVLCGVLQMRSVFLYANRRTGGESYFLPDFESFSFDLFFNSEWIHVTADRNSGSFLKLINGFVFGRDDIESNVDDSNENIIECTIPNGLGKFTWNTSGNAWTLTPDVDSPALALSRENTQEIMTDDDLTGLLHIAHAVPVDDAVRALSLDEIEGDFDFDLAVPVEGAPSAPPVSSGDDGETIGPLYLGYIARHRGVSTKSRFPSTSSLATLRLLARLDRVLGVLNGWSCKHI